MSLSTSTVLLPSSDIAKDTRDFLRSRQLRLKPHDRSKSKGVRSNRCTCAWCTSGPNKLTRGHKRHVPSAAVKDDEARELAAQTPSRRVLDRVATTNAHIDANAPSVEVPLLSLLKPVKHKYVFGSDFEIVDRPQRVIVLDDMDEDGDEEDWEQVASPLSPKSLPTAVIEIEVTTTKTSYAAVVKG